MFRRILQFLSRFVAVTVTLAVILWCAGRLVTDRFWWTQYLAWMPSLAVVVLGGIGISLSMILARLGKDTAKGRRLRLLATLGVTACLAVLLLVDWRVHAFVPFASGQGGRSIRVAAWNPSQWNQRLVPSCIDRTTDLAFIANPSIFVKWPSWQESMGGIAGPDSGVQLIAAGRLVVLSKLPVLRWGSVYYVSRGMPNPPDRSAVMLREGSIMFVEIDATATLGRPIIVWFVDMPSDPWVSKSLLVRELIDFARGWTGPEWTRDADGADRTRAVSSKGFPPPDMVLGDFNIPRGSYSLSLFRDAGNDSLHNAFRDAGRSLGGFNAASFPRHWPLWHLDNTLLARELVAIDYDLIDTGESRHRMQMIELTRRPASR